MENPVVGVLNLRLVGGSSTRPRVNGISYLVLLVEVEAVIRIMLIKRIMERKWNFGGGYAVAFAMCLFVSSNAAGGVYKCVDKLGNTGYQAKPCDYLDKSTQVEIEEFEKPATVTTQESEASDSSSGQEARNETAERREKQRVAAKLERKEKACKKLKASYGRQIKNAKARDKASGGKIKKRSKQQPYNKAKEEKELKRASKCLKNRMAGKPCKKKKSKRRQKYTKISATHYLDLAKAGYRKEKKRLGCR